MTTFLQNFTIRTRMLGAIAMVLALMALLGLTGTWGLRQVEAIGDDFVAHTHADTVALADLSVALGNVRRFEKDLLINRDSATELAAYRTKWNAAVDHARSQAHALGGSGRPALAQAATQLDASIASYAEAAAPVWRLVDSGVVKDAAVGNRALAEAKKFIQAGESHVAELTALLDRETAASSTARHDAASRALWTFVIALAVAVGVVVPLTLVNMVSICGPIGSAQNLAERISSGDLTGRIIITGHDESAHLLRSLVTMQDSLRTLVGQVRTATDGVRTASAEIATGNQDLSARTEQTASSLQQAASSMVQLTGTVKQSADSARQANQLAASAAEVAQRGGSVVAQVVSTMEDINTSSKKIADIIGVIDGIAFQTNILALNAAVEAARAGEQGRGFAVVASEVRSLAQRSADAAKEIKGLIGASVDKVEGGSRLVADAGRTMSEIVSSVQRVSDIIGEITAAASEQSEGIGQVNGSVNQLDQMTQQNAALVEQSAAAAESLKDQATRLAQVVGTFRIDSSSLAAAPAPAPARAPSTAAAKPKLAAKPIAPLKPRAASAPAASRATPAPAPRRPEPVTASAAAEGDWETF